MHQTPRKFGRAQTTDPAEFSWCRARDLNPHGKPIRPSSVRVCQFRQPGTDSRDHYTAPVRSPARRVMKSVATRLLSEKGKVRRGDNEQDCADGSEAGKERFSPAPSLGAPGGAAPPAPTPPPPAL